MPVSYECMGRLVRMEMSGRYGPEEIQSCLQSALLDPACPEAVALLLDVRWSRSLSERSNEQLRAASEFLEPYAARIGGKCAVLVDNELHYGLIRLASVYTEHVGVDADVFTGEDEALKWLGVDAAGAPLPPDGDAPAG